MYYYIDWWQCVIDFAINVNSISHSIHDVDAQKHFIDHYKYRHEMEIYLHQDKREKVF